VLAVIVLGVIVTAFQYQEKITKAVDAKDAAVDQQYTEAARRIEKVNQMRAQQQQVVRRAELAGLAGREGPQEQRAGGIRQLPAPGAFAVEPCDGIQGTVRHRPARDDRL
jgi:hypothetical protein